MPFHSRSVVAAAAADDVVFAVDGLSERKLVPDTNLQRHERVPKFHCLDQYPMKAFHMTKGGKRQGKYCLV